MKEHHIEVSEFNVETLKVVTLSGELAEILENPSRLDMNGSDLMLLPCSVDMLYELVSQAVSKGVALKAQVPSMYQKTIQACLNLMRMIQNEEADMREQVRLLTQKIDRAEVEKGLAHPFGIN